MLIIHHRLNHVTDLAGIPAHDGAEIDLRTAGASMILNHEPFEEGDRLEDYLDLYGRNRRAPLVINVKEDLLETPAIALCQRRGLENLFFLDCALPTLVRLANDGFSKLAVRVSEYETVDLPRLLRGKVEWAWIDCFTGRVPETSLLREVQALGYRICLVSPELQGYDTAVVEKHLQTRVLLRAGIDAVCTKFADRWRLA